MRLELLVAKMLVAPNTGKSIIGCDWLITLRYRICQPIERGECKVNIKIVKCAEAVTEISPAEKISPEVKQIMREFPNLSKRKGRVKNHELQIDIRENAKIRNKKAVESHFNYRSKYTMKSERSYYRMRILKKSTNFKMTFLSSQQ